MFNTPKFWHKKGFLAFLFIPFSVIYFLIKRVFTAFEKPSQKFNFTTIFVGNPIAGGSGKTPSVAAIAKLVRENYPQKKLCVISKGYGGSIIEPEILDVAKHTAEEAGDEPLILAKYADVIIAKNRFKACAFAAEKNYEITIFDDGMHDNRIEKDLCIMVIDGKYGFGNGLVFPAGPLRDRLDIATKNTTHTLLIGRDEKNIIQRLEKRSLKTPIIKASVSSLTSPDKKQSYIAFAGLARPEKFFDMLKINMGLNIAETIDFPDHYNYDNGDLNYIKSLAESYKAKILTTEKDYVKLPELFQKEVEAIKIELKFEDDKMLEILEKTISDKG